MTVRDPAMREGLRFAPRKNASRKFTDIILSSVSKWANWDPSIPVEAGDYGRIDKKTGQFEREGNIYRDPDVADIAKEYPAATGPCIASYRIHTMDARSVNVTPEIHANLLGMAQPQIGGQWQFSRSRGALLLLYKSYITSIPNELLVKLKVFGWSKGKCIVTHSQACCGYFLYLSDKSSEVVNVTLQADVPLPMAPGVTPGLGINVGWHSTGTSGVSQEALNEEPVFYPLYQLKETTRKGILGRRSPDEDSDEECDPDDISWVPVEVPWNPLDEDGLELSEEFSQGDSDPEEADVEMEEEDEEEEMPEFDEFGEWP